MSFFVGVCMNKTRLKKTELKSIRLHIRLSEQMNNYLNYCSDFFSVSKSFFYHRKKYFTSAGLCT